MATIEFDLVNEDSQVLTSFSVLPNNSGNNDVSSDSPFDIFSIIKRTVEIDLDALVGPLTFSSTGEEIIGTDEADVLNGTDGNDVILGLGEADDIFGNGGDDTIIGGRGFDVLTGGPGSDTFIFEDALDRIDGIPDFEVAVDVLDFSNILDQQRYSSANPLEDYFQFEFISAFGAGGTSVEIDLNGDFGQNDRFVPIVFLLNITPADLSAANFIL